MAIAGYGGSVLVSSTPNVALTDEILTDSGDHKTFNISSSSFATKRYWDDTATFVVETSTDGGSTWSTAAVGTYSIRYVTGQVVLNSALTGTPACRIHSGAYLPFSTFSSMKEWEATPTGDMLDATSFSDGGWKAYVPGLLGSEIKLTQFYTDLTFTNLITNRTKFIVSCLTGRNSTERFEAFGYLKGDDIKVAVNALEEESLTYSVTGQLYYFSGQYA